MDREYGAFFKENAGRITEFGEYFLEKLADKKLIDGLAEKDLEKLARIFKLLFDKLDEQSEPRENPVLLEIAKSFGTNNDGQLTMDDEQLTIDN